MNLRDILQRSTLYFFCSIASRAVGFFLIPLYSRFLTPAEYGTIELLELATQILSLCFGLQSIGSALARVFHDGASEEWRNQVTTTAVAMTGGANLVLIALVAPFAGKLSTLVFHASGYGGLIQAGLVGLMLSTLVEVALTYVRLRDRVGLFVGYTLTILLVTTLLNIYFIAFKGMGVWGFVYSKLIATGAGCIYLTGMTLRESGLRASRAAAKQMSRFGSPLVLANLAFFAIHFSDRFFLSADRDLDAVGTYSLAYRFAFLVTVLVGEPFGRVWSVNLYTYVNSPNWEAQFARIARYLTLSLCTVCLGLCLFGEQIIRLMSTKAYYAAAVTLPVLTFAYVLREAGDFYRNILYINHRSDAVGVIAAGSALVNLVLNFILIDRYGAMGAAWSTFATWGLYLALCWARARREHAIPFDLRSFATPFLIAAAIYLVVTRLPQLPVALDLAMRAAWIAAFAILIWIFRYFPEEEMHVLRRKVSDGYGDIGKWVRARI
jgi:O-antigen/teichoic acid export membrane protein